MATVGIVMGSDSDMPVMAKAAEMLDRFGIDYEMKIISAHRDVYKRQEVEYTICGGKKIYEKEMTGEKA